MSKVCLWPLYFLTPFPLSPSLTHSLPFSDTHTHTQAPFWCTSHWHNYPYSYNYQQIPNPNSYFDSNLMLFFAQLQTKSWNLEELPHSVRIWKMSPKQKHIFFCPHKYSCIREKHRRVPGLEGWLMSYNLSRSIQVHLSQKWTDEGKRTILLKSRSFIVSLNRDTRWTRAQRCSDGASQAESFSPFSSMAVIRVPSPRYVLLSF